MVWLVRSALAGVDIGVATFFIAVANPSAMAVGWRIASGVIVALAAVWLAIDHIATCGGYKWFRGALLLRHIHVSATVGVSERKDGSSSMCCYLTAHDRHGKDEPKTIRMDLWRYMWNGRRERLMDDIPTWLVEHGSDAVVAWATH